MTPPDAGAGLLAAGPDVSRETVIGPGEGDGVVTVVASPHPLTAEQRRFQARAGDSIAEILERAQPRAELRRFAHVTVDGRPVAAEDFASTRIPPGALVNARMVPQGGDDGKLIGAVVLTVAIIAASFLLPPLLPATAFTIGGAAISWGSVAAFGVGLAGSLAFAALVPSSDNRLADLSGGQDSLSRTSDAAFIQGARNVAKPWGVVPQVLGCTDYVAPLGALTYTEIRDGDQYFKVLLHYGFGELQLSNIRIGETPIDEFDDVRYIIHPGKPSDPDLTIFTQNVVEQNTQIDLTAEASPIVRTSETGATALSVDITFITGLVELRVNEGGDRAGQIDEYRRQVDFLIEYAPAGSGNYVTVFSEGVIDNSRAAVRRTFRWDTDGSDPGGQYDIRITRLTADSTSNQIIDASTITAIRTFRADSPIDKADQALIEIEVRANGQFSVVDQIKVYAETVALDWDGGAWIARPTNNPASLARLVLQGPQNPIPRSDDELDLASFQQAHQDFASAGRTCNMVIDYASSVSECVSDILRCGRATAAEDAGRVRIVVDKPQTVPVQMITTANSWDDSGNRDMSSMPHALNGRFVNEANGYQQEDVIVYRDGYGETAGPGVEQATKFESFQMPGCTDYDQFWKAARYYLKVLELRGEVYFAHMDPEFLVARRGEMMRLESDTHSFGLGSGRVLTWARDGQNDATGATLDIPVEMETGLTYDLLFRPANAAQFYQRVVTADGEQRTVTFETPIPAATVPEDGCLWAFSETQAAVADCLLLDIQPIDNENAKLQLVPLANAVHDDDGTTPPPAPGNVGPISKLVVPVVRSTRSDFNVMRRAPDGTYIERILVSWLPVSSTQRIQGIQARWRVADSIDQFLETPEVPASWVWLAMEPVQTGVFYEYQLRYVGIDQASGEVRNSDWGPLLIHQVIGLNGPWPVPRGFTALVSKDWLIQFTWRIDHLPADVRTSGGVQIRMSTIPDQAWEDMTPIHEGLISDDKFSSWATTADTYYFAIKSVNGVGLESVEDRRVAVVVAEVEGVTPFFVFIAQDHGWAGTITGANITPENHVRALSTGGWDAIYAQNGKTWADLAKPFIDLIDGISPITYETDEIDLLMSRDWIPHVSLSGRGEAIIEMATSSSSGSPGAWGPLAPSNQRYCWFRVTMTDARRPEIFNMLVQFLANF